MMKGGGLKIVVENINIIERCEIFMKRWRWNELKMRFLWSIQQVSLQKASAFFFEGFFSFFSFYICKHARWKYLWKLSYYTEIHFGEGKQKGFFAIFYFSRKDTHGSRKKADKKFSPFSPLLFSTYWTRWISRGIFVFPIKLIKVILFYLFFLFSFF